MKLTAIDYGAALGWAFFCDAKLIACGLLRTKAKSPGERVRDHVAKLSSVLADSDRVVVERGTWRGGGKGSMPPAQLADFNASAGQLAGWYGELVTPDEWKGRVPKDKHQPRIIAALTADERAVLADAKVAPSLLNNVIDAIGIGLFAVGRLGKPVLVPIRKQARRRARSSHVRMPVKEAA